jgi:hypothetical protein
MRGEGAGSRPAGFLFTRPAVSLCAALFDQVHSRSAAFALSGLVNLKIPPHLESVVEVNSDEAEVWGGRRHSVDESTMRLRFGQLKGAPLKENRFYWSRECH